MKWKLKHTIAARLQYVYIKKVTTRKTKSKKIERKQRKQTERETKHAHRLKRSTSKIQTKTKRQKD